MEPATYWLVVRCTDRWAKEAVNKLIYEAIHVILHFFWIILYRLEAVYIFSNVDVTPAVGL